MLTGPPESLAAVNAERFSMLVSSSGGGSLGWPGLWGDGHETGCSALREAPGGRLGCSGAGWQRPWIGGRHRECRPSRGCAGRAHGAARCVVRCAATAACRRLRPGGCGTAQAAVRGRTPGDHDHSARDACSDVDRLPRRQVPGQAVSPRCSSGRARKAVRRAAMRGTLLAVRLGRWREHYGRIVAAHWPGSCPASLADLILSAVHHPGQPYRSCAPAQISQICIVADDMIRSGRAAQIRRISRA